MREFSNLEEAKAWVLQNGGGRRVKVVVGKNLYWLEVKDPTAELRRHILHQEKLARMWKVLGALVVVAWTLAVLWIIGS